MDKNKQIHSDLYKIALAARTSESVFAKEANRVYAVEPKNENSNKTSLLSRISKTLGDAIRPHLKDGEKTSVETEHAGIIAAGLTAVTLGATVPVTAPAAIPVGLVATAIGGVLLVTRGAIDKKTNVLESKEREAQDMYGNALAALTQIYTGQININDFESAEDVITQAVLNNRERCLANTIPTAKTKEEAIQCVKEAFENYPNPNHENFVELHGEAQNLPGYEEAQVEAANSLQHYTQIQQRNGDYATPGTDLENLVAEGQNIVKLQVESLNAQSTQTEDFAQQ